jgi:hypothetical protein
LPSQRYSGGRLRAIVLVLPVDDQGVRSFEMSHTPRTPERNPRRTRLCQGDDAWRKYCRLFPAVSTASCQAEEGVSRRRARNHTRSAARAWPEGSPIIDRDQRRIGPSGGQDVIEFLRRRRP